MPNTSKAISEYATAEEIDALNRALRERWKRLGQQMRKPGFDGESEFREQWVDRKSINRGLKLIARGELPILLDDYSGAKDLLAPFHARYEAAKAASWKRRKEEIAETPIDDAAWNAELQRRAWLDARKQV
jgi:hypothetical protein